MRLFTPFPPYSLVLNAWFASQVTFFSALYMAINPWYLFYDADRGEICPYT